MRVRTKSDQTGTLYELPLIGAALLMAGLLLTPKHGAFFILCLLGLLVLFLPYILHFVFTLWYRVRLHRVLKSLRQSGIVVRYLLIGGGHAVVIDNIAGKVVWIEGDESTSDNLAGIESVQLVPVSWTRLGGPTRTIYTVRFVHNGKNTDFEQGGLWRARRVIRKVKKYLAPATVVTEKHQVT